ncbi:hypothetical protein F4806DRAFT_482572 [Annulohypoxylon nitens]|nr:hypothetical protein F4806DRAFT_482572 [Annulohypoxylon nitens]
MAEQNNQVRQKLTPVSPASIVNYDSDEDKTIEQLTDGTMLARPRIPRSHSYNSSFGPRNLEMPLRQGTSRTSGSKGQRFVPYRPGAIWRSNSIAAPSTSALSQSNTTQHGDRPQNRLTADNVRWPFLDDDDEGDEDLPSPAFPAVPLPDAPLRRRGAIRRPSSIRSANSAIFPSSPTSPIDDGHNISSPLSRVAHDPQRAVAMRGLNRSDSEESGATETNQSWFPGDDGNLEVKDVLERKTPKREG